VGTDVHQSDTAYDDLEPTSKTKSTFDQSNIDRLEHVKVYTSAAAIHWFRSKCHLAQHGSTNPRFAMDNILQTTAYLAGLPYLIAIASC